MGQFRCLVDGDLDDVFRLVADRHFRYRKCSRGFAVRHYRSATEDSASVRTDAGGLGDNECRRKNGRLETRIEACHDAAIGAEPSVAYSVLIPSFPFSFSGGESRRSQRSILMYARFRSFVSSFESPRLA